MKAASILVCLALLTLQSAAQHAVTFPKILEGGGRACYGHLWRTDKTLYWKAVFTSCRSPYTVVSQEREHWLLKVEKSKTCAYELIDVQSYDSDMYPWNVVGYPHAADLHNKEASILGCGMFPVTYPINPDARRHHKGAGK